MAYTILERARPYMRHLSLIGAILGLLWCGITFVLSQDHTAAVKHALADAENLTRTFDENITRTVASVDQTLQYLRDAYRQDPHGFMHWAALSGRPALHDPQVQIGVADSDGNMIWSNFGPVLTGLNIADREHFRAQLTSNDDSLFISRPVVGRVSGKWVIQFTRKLLPQHGVFAGIVVVSLDPHYIVDFYRSISIGKGAIILATRDGAILARTPENDPLNSIPMPNDRTARLPVGLTNGGAHVVSDADQVDRIYSVRHSDHYPLTLAVGLASEDVFADYERNKRLYLILGVSASIAGIAAGLVLARQRSVVLGARESLSRTLENMNQGVAMVDASGALVVLSRKAVEMLDLPREWTVNKPTFQQVVDWQFAHGEYQGADEARLGRTFRPLEVAEGFHIYERTRPDGTALEVRTQVMPDGSFVRTFTDVTERKRTEAALAAAQTRAAHAERLQALGQLAGGIAHDFNNVLQAVQGGASLLVKRAADPDSVRRLAHLILDATERGTSITGRLLAFGRRGNLRAEVVDVAMLLPALEEMLRLTLGAAIKVEVRLAEGLPKLLADRGQLETVLVNLATNARDAMPDGGVLTLAAGAASSHSMPSDLQPGSYVQITVADTGIGMDMATAARATEPFFSTKPSGKGTGLGLSMARGFVEQSDGMLSLDSAPGQGTAVHLWLPVASEIGAVPATPPGDRQPDAARSAGAHILLVDDEDMVRETLALSLEAHGYPVIAAAGGLEALTILESDKEVDLMVTDLSMPGIDGLALIRKARARHPSLPVILLTGYAGAASQLAAGGAIGEPFALVSKPVTPAQLADKIDALRAVAAAG